MRIEPAEDIFANLSELEAHQFITNEPPSSVEQLRERDCRRLVGHSTDQREVWFNWIIRDNRSSESIGYTQATITKRAAVFGYHLASRFWQRGIGTRAVEKTILNAVAEHEREIISARTKAALAIAKATRSAAWPVRV